MSTKKKEDIDVYFANGWVHGYEITEDETEGEIKLVAGLPTRLRLSDIWGYQIAERGILSINIRHLEKPIFIVGSLEAMDKVVARENLKEVTC